MATTHHILNNEALVFSTERPGIYQVTARKHFSQHHNFALVICADSELRAATKADFDNFRVCWKYHLPE